MKVTGDVTYSHPSVLGIKAHNFMENSNSVQACGSRSTGFPWSVTEWARETCQILGSSLELGVLVKFAFHADRVQTHNFMITMAWILAFSIAKHDFFIWKTVIPSMSCQQSTFSQQNEFWVGFGSRPPCTVHRHRYHGLWPCCWWNPYQIYLCWEVIEAFLMENINVFQLCQVNAMVWTAIYSRLPIILYSDVPQQCLDLPSPEENAWKGNQRASPWILQRKFLLTSRLFSKETKIRRCWCCDHGSLFMWIRGEVFRFSDLLDNNKNDVVQRLLEISVQTTWNKNKHYQNF